MHINLLWTLKIFAKFEIYKTIDKLELSFVMWTVQLRTVWSYSPFQMPVQISLYDSSTKSTESYRRLKAID